MRLSVLLLTLILLPISAWAQEYHERNVRVNLYPYNNSGIRFVDPSSPALPRSSCFPFSCERSILGPFRNPDPTARDEENLTSCIYGADGILLYEREGKVCSYKFVDANTSRVERRRQEWLRQQTRNGEASQ